MPETNTRTIACGFRDAGGRLSRKKVLRVNREGVAIALFFAIYGLLTVPWIFWPVSNLVLSLIVFVLYSILAIGLAIDTTEVILSLWWPRHSLPRLKAKASPASTAIVMTICDDSTPQQLRNLQCLESAGYDLYLLDDSISPVTFSGVLHRVTHVRRGHHTGAKAGNLNNWVNEHGQQYRYVIVLDADSTVSIETVQALIQAAEHPANANVAVFQAKIDSSYNQSLFAWLLSAGARPRMRIVERVYGPLGILLSYGHNQLLRLEPILAIGGFDEILTGEDTSLSLQLARGGWRTDIVDVWTCDTDPQTVEAYIRRTTRWARQTIELFLQPWFDVPLRLKLIVCRDLLSYVLPLVALLLLGISLWTGPATPKGAWNFLVASLSFSPGYEIYGLTLWPALFVVCLLIVLRTILAWLEGVPWRLFFLSSLLGNPACSVLAVPLAGSMLASALGFKVRFVPTNSSYRRGYGEALRHQLIPVLSAVVLLSIMLVGALRHPGSLLVGFNLLWVTQLAVSPLALLIVWIASRRPEALERFAHRGS
jgi:hypothetical protein